MRYLSVCSGIEAATVAWHPLGWEAVAFAEIDPFPCAVLRHHYPAVPNWGDMTRFQEWPDAVVDVLVGGTPCQSFSVAGLRQGLADPRGNLALAYLAVLDRYRPRWCCWENVPGVLSSNGGRDFGALLGGLGQLGYGWAYRVLDAQYFGLAQRRARVFVVGCRGDWRRAAAVLFERESLSGHPPPSRDAGESVAPTVGSGPPFSRTGNQRVEAEAMVLAPTLPARRTAGGGLGTDFDCDVGLIHCAEVSPALETTANDYSRADGFTMIAHSLRAEGFDASEDGTGRGTPLIAFDTTQVTSTANYSHPKSGDPCHPLAAGAHPPAVAFQPRFARNGRRAPDIIASALTGEAGRTGKGDSAQCVAFAQNTRDEVREMPYAGALASEPGMKQTTYLRQAMQVRRLTPRECCRLQGFPDDYLDILYRGKPAADGPKYKALGNSMAVPVMAWIGRRIQMVHDLPEP